MTSSFWPPVSAPASSRSRIGSARCSVRVSRACRSSSPASTGPVTSRSATVPQNCNSRASAAPARCGTSTRPSRPPGDSPRQLAETPDGVRYLSVATELAKAGGGYNAPRRRYAIALGCEVTYASDFVYADGLDMTNRAAFDPIGISCRICQRPACPQRCCAAAHGPTDGRSQQSRHPALFHLVEIPDFGSAPGELSRWAVPPTA